MTSSDPPPEGGWRARLRALPVFPPELPGLPLDRLPETPLELLGHWLGEAIDAGVLQPHAATLSTADGHGRPSSRTLIVKDLAPEGLWFAKLRTSPGGRQLEAVPEAALLLYWRELGRQVRVEGTVEAAPAAVSAADFLARHPAARAEVLLGRQSEPLGEPEEAAALLAAAAERVEAEPGLVAEDWTAYLLRPRAVEFWAASSTRAHRRIRYTRDTGGAWRHDRLWA